MTEQITIHSLQFSYQKGQPVLTIPELAIPLHQMTILHGHSGSGKSTLLKIIAGLLPKYGGHLTGNIDIPDHQTTAMMFQDPGMQFALDTPRHEIEFALENLQVQPQKMSQMIDQALHEVGINALADRQFTSLSGGEQQRATLAVIVAMQRDIILLDEPFASLDSMNRQRILSQLVKMQQAGKTIIIADHDLSAYENLHPQIVDFNTSPISLLNSATVDQLLRQAAHVTWPKTASPNPQSPATIQLTDFKLQRRDQPLIRTSHLMIPQNKVTLLTGESGSGKSSFLKACANLIPYSGHLKVNEREIQTMKGRQLGNTIGMMFQNANDQFLNVTVREEIQLSQTNGHHPYFKQHLDEAMNSLELDHLMKRVVYTLSGGQKKKLQLLVMLMMGQPLLLLDEPFTGLDPQSIQAVIKLIQQCRKVLPQTMLIVSHQLGGVDGIVNYHLHLVDHQLHYIGGEAE